METLVALLISSFALLMLAGSITTASSIVERSRKKMDDYYTANEEMVIMPATVGSSNITKSTGSLTVSTLSSDSTLSIPPQEIVYYQNNAFSGSDPIITYRSKTSQDS